LNTLDAKLQTAKNKIEPPADKSPFSFYANFQTTASNLTRQPYRTDHKVSNNVKVVPTERPKKEAFM